MSGRNSDKHVIFYLAITVGQHLFCLKSKLLPRFGQVVIMGNTCDRSLSVFLSPLPEIRMEEGKKSSM